MAAITNQVINVNFDDIEAASARNVVKKMKRTTEPFDFRLIFSPTSPLLTLVSTLKNLLTTVRFQILKTDAFEGIKCDSTSPALTCMVKSRLTCSVDIDSSLNEGKRTEFSVNIDEFAQAIKATNGTNVIEIIRYRSKNKIDVVCPRSNPLKRFRIRALLQDPVDNRLNKMDCKFQVQIRLSDFKDFCRNASTFKADTISISIDMPQEAAKDGTTKTFIEFGAVSDSTDMTYIYDPNTKTNEKGQVIVVCDQQTTMSEYEELKPAYKRVYTDQFSVEFLNSFFKSMEKSSIWINLTDKDGPMIVHYGLGNESYMRLVLAPKENVE